MSYKFVTKLDNKKGVVESDNESEASCQGQCNFAEDTTGNSTTQDLSCTSENESTWTQDKFSEENIGSDEVRQASLLSQKVKESLLNEITERSAFDKLIDDNILESIVTYTNQQIRTCTNKQFEKVQPSTSTSASTSASTSSCTDIEQQEITKEELNGLLGLLYFTGTRKTNNTKENLRDLWSNDGTGLYLCYGIMSYKRLRFLLRNLRLSNEDTQAKKNLDKFASVRDIWNKFWTNCRNSYQSTGHFAICDRVFRFPRCQHTSLQTKNELRFIAMVDLRTYFTCKMEPCYGQQLELTTVDELIDSVNSDRKHVTVYSDRYADYYSVASHLLDKNVTFLGAIKKSQPDIPPLDTTKGPVIFIKSSKNKEEQHIFLVADQTDISQKPDVIISTIDKSKIINKQTQKPVILETYNNEKNALNEMQYESCSVSVITRSLSLAVLFTILDVAAINAHVLYNVAYKTKFSKDPSISRTTFRRNLALSLMTPLMENKVKQKDTFSEIRGMILNYLITNSHLARSDIPSEMSKCYLCKHKDIKAKQRCYKCKELACLSHASETEVICKQCDKLGL